MGGAPGLMKPEETHVYIWLLCLEWNQTGFVYDPAKLARWCRVSERQFLKAWKVVGECFEARDDGRLYNTRLEAERAKQEEWRAKSAEGGRRSAEARAQAKTNGGGDGGGKGGSRVVEPPHEPNGNIPFPTTTPFPVTAGSSGTREDVADVERTAPTDPREIVILLTSAGNQGITARFGEQPSPLVWSSGSTTEVVDAVIEHQIPVLFARDAIYSAASSCVQPHAPKGLKYFLPQLLRAWSEELARKAASTSPTPKVIPLTASDRRKSGVRDTIDALLAPIPKEMR